MNELLEVDQQPDFDGLGRLHDYLHGLLEDADASLRAFYVDGSGGFAHRLDATRPDDEPLLSKASTATCIALLFATGRLDDAPWGPERGALIDSILTSDWTSARLEPDNPFTVSFLLEALHHLGGHAALPDGGADTVAEKVQVLVAHVLDDGGADRRGGVALQEYDATAFLTYKAVSALSRWGALDGEVREAVERWNWNHLYKESVLVASQSADADVFEVAYSALIATSVAELDEMTPQQRSLLRYALGQFFTAQRPDGTWPRSRPLFVYRDLGHAYCYDYELLAALLSDRQLRPVISERLGRLRRAAQALDVRKYPLGAAVAAGEKAPYGWSSGHHGTYAAAESWATAAALHFAFVLAQLVAERIRQETFEYVGAPYRPPTAEPGAAQLPDYFLDSVIKDGTPPTMLKATLTDKLIAPLLAVRDDLMHGKALSKKTPGGMRVPTSAILFGPPGTSKSELADLIASALGWPLLALDPSHLTRRGLDAVHSEANRLFGMLQRCEQVVVLLDEFDELVREREGGSEMESRFLTTAMLPKLTALYKARRIVYLVATNHVEQFDAAIRRPGRFDLILPVMPPTAAEKERNWPKIKDAIEAWPEGARPAARADLASLIFLEAKDMADAIDAGADAAAIAQFAERCTMRQPVDPHADGQEDWGQRMVQEIDKRIRGV